MMHAGVWTVVSCTECGDLHPVYFDGYAGIWIYEECRAAVEAFDDGTLTSDDDSDHEYADGRVDTYTKDLYQWAANFCLTDTWAEAEQEAKDVGLPDETDRRIACIQYAAIRQIAETIRAACAQAVEAA
jgi:hypothetical protein